MSRKSISKVATLFWFILFLGIALRVYRLTQVPASLNPDEAALGYTAYSLLKTGADEHGESFPLIFKSFGDWKMGLYSYLTILPVALFDLTETTTKFVSVISGISGILLIYLLGVELFGQRKIGLLSSLFYSLSPWGIFFSRMALEVNLATTLFTGALLLFLKYSKSHNIKLLFFSATIFILTMLAYHAYLLFTPLFLFLTLFFYRGRFIISKGLVFSVLLVLFFALLLGYIVYQASGNKLGDLSIMTPPTREIFSKSFSIINISDCPIIWCKTILPPFLQLFFLIKVDRKFCIILAIAGTFIFSTRY